MRFLQIEEHDERKACLGGPHGPCVFETESTVGRKVGRVTAFGRESPVGKYLTCKFSQGLFWLFFFFSSYFYLEVQVKES